MDDDVASLEGPIELVNGKLTLLIPLEAGGDQFVECSRGISEIQGDHLKIVIPEWLADSLRVEAGDMVSINNANGKFNITAVKPRLVQ